MGGTPNSEPQTVSTAVLSLGQYTLGEMDKIQELDLANLKPYSLTYQPRVFCPKGNSFSLYTTIYLNLDSQLMSPSKSIMCLLLVEWIA
mgnify:CR=1 FL=1